MTDDPGQRAIELNRRARLMRAAARQLPETDIDLAIDLLHEAYAVATEAMQLVLETGAIPGEQYYHHDDGVLDCGPIGWLEADR